MVGRTSFVRLFFSLLLVVLLAPGSMSFVASWGSRKPRAGKMGELPLAGAVGARRGEGLRAGSSNGSSNGVDRPPAAQVVASFPARPFEPAPLHRNEHWQTIWGARVIQDALLQAVAPTPSDWFDVYDRREKWDTPDGDFFHADWLFSTHAGSPGSGPAPGDAPRPVAIVLHGLESTSSALLPRSMAKAFARRGFDVLALNFRGCCGNDNVQPYAYHLGWTEDLIFSIRRLHEEDPRRRIYLTGFSVRITHPSPSLLSVPHAYHPCIRF